MKKTLLITGALLALTVGMASAAGLNLSWTDCGLNGASVRTFACTSNSGTNIAVSSYIVPAGVDSANSNEIVIDIQTSGATLPSWWMMGTGFCRPTSLSMNFSGFTGPCMDYWAGRGAGGSNYTAPFGPPNRARVKAVWALSRLDAGPIPTDQEVYSNNLFINNAKSFGAGACGGCTDGACIVLNSINVTQNPLTIGAKFIGNPADRNWVTWQAGVPNCGNNVTPARNTTWGTLKALYR